MRLPPCISSFRVLNTGKGRCHPSATTRRRVCDIKWVATSIYANTVFCSPIRLRLAPLHAEPYKAGGDAWLSPETRLLADAPAAPEDLVYDGQGHQLVLPADVTVRDPVPVIVVGPGRTLILKNLTLVHSASLPACLQLAAGEGLHHLHQFLAFSICS